VKEGFDRAGTGRWRRIRSLYCLTWVATLKRVRMIVEGWACASAVCCNVESARHGAGRRRHTREATAAHSRERWSPHVRSLRRSTLTALMAFSQLPPGTIEIFIQHRRGGGLERRRDKARVIARAHHFGLQHDAPRNGRRLPMDVGERAPLVMEAPRRLDSRSRLAEQDALPARPRQNPLHGRR